MPVCLSVCLSAWLAVCLYVCMYVCILLLRIESCHIYMYVCMYVCMYIYIYIYSSLSNLAPWTAEVLMFLKVALRPVSLQDQTTRERCIREAFRAFRDRGVLV